MGTIDTLGVSLIVAMAMQRTFVVQRFSAALTFWGDMVNFNDVSILKKQLTPAAFAALSLQQLAERSIDHGMSSQSLTPIEDLSIIRTCRSLDFAMSLNLGAIMFPQDRFLIAKNPSLPFCHMPVGIRDPEHAFVRMAASGPALELLKQDESAVMERFRRHHTAIVVRSAMDHLIQFFDELSL